jgi:hypothetical protein
MTRILLATTLAFSMVMTACAPGSGAPSAAGQYAVQRGTVQFDGDAYELYWADSSGGLHRMHTDQLRLVQDPERTFLEVPPSGDPILHLQQDEPISVHGEDQQGAFSSPWFPFLAGAMLSNALSGRGGLAASGGPIIINNPAPGERAYQPNTPAYRYPPTGSFGRGEQLNGSLDSGKAQVPDYARLQPSPYATTGKTAGTGGGVAASNKGGFLKGAQAYSNSRGATGAGKPSTGLTKPSTGAGKPSTGLSKPSTGSKGIGGARVGRR